MKVKFIPQNVEFEIQPNQTVKDVADKNGVFIKSICNGLPSCAECRVKIVDGEYNVLPPANKEINLIGTGYFIDRRRLSCQLICFGDITVDLTEQVEKQKNAGALRPQGSRKPETETSHAVTGNLIEQDLDLKNIKSPVETNAPKPQRAHRPHPNQRPNQNPQNQQQSNSGHPKNKRHNR